MQGFLRSKNHQKHTFYRVFCVFRFPSNFDGFLIAYSKMLRKQHVLLCFSGPEATVPCLFFRCFCMFAFQKCVENIAFSCVFHVSSAPPQTFVFSHPLRLEFMCFFKTLQKHRVFTRFFNLDANLVRFFCGRFEPRGPPGLPKRAFQRRSVPPGLQNRMFWMHLVLSDGPKRAFRKRSEPPDLPKRVFRRC